MDTIHNLPHQTFFSRLRKSGEAPHSLFFSSPLRSLSSSEISALEDAGNFSPDWDNILVTASFTATHIRNSCFEGHCFLGSFSSRLDAAEFPPLATGIYNSTLHDAAVADDCLISSVTLLAGYHVERNSLLLDCGRVTYTVDPNCWLSYDLIPGNEMGGREIPILPGITVEDALHACCGEKREAAVQKMLRLREQYLSWIKESSGLIGKGSRISGVPLIQDCLIGSGSVLENCCEVSGSFLADTIENPASITGGAIVRQSVVASGSRVDTQAVVVRSCLETGCHVERHARVTCSYCGTGCGIGEGEVSSSLLGPLVAMHHQSLLIAAIWPDGRGNVGYGANIGSNHTCRAPDQEIFIGEGCFFGLSCSVKYPADLSRAPHSVIATAVTLPPGRVEYPLSLILEEEGRLTIKPGWLWGGSCYTLLRNQYKYSSKEGIARPLISCETTWLVSEALTYLQNQGKRAAEIRGLGPCILKEKDREMGIRSYKELLRYAVVEHAFLSADCASILQELPDSLLLQGGVDRSDLLEDEKLGYLYRRERDELLHRARRSRVRDRTRGELVQGALYLESHPEEDPVLKALQEELHSQG